ncbi:hypothetical protein ACE6ED_12090 [Paenibacillus sp. CN-4]|uniref:hypothetical protein n=1 Tax=Paenibacillus nanchangensis TaxID=3348343 RepID=UPI00397C47EF
MKLNRTTAVVMLTAALTLTAVPVSPVQAAPQPAAAANAAKVFNQFERYVKDPQQLAMAVKYLKNHVDEVDKWTGTRMTLQLENAQNALLGTVSERFYPEAIQDELGKAYTKHQTLSLGKLMNSGGLKDKTHNLLYQLSQTGYKLETSEGLYYPVLDYDAYKTLKPYIGKDIGIYIDLMAAESNQPSTYDAGVVIPWSELIDRAAAAGDFVKRYPGSSRIKNVKEMYGLYKSHLLFGDSNTPAYDSFSGEQAEPELDAELREAYELAVKKLPAGSELKAMLKQLLVLLDESGNKLTPKIQRYLDEQADQ